MQKEIPSKWDGLYSDWCKICLHEKTPICDECSVHERSCVTNKWTQINPLSLQEYLDFLFHKCLHCRYLEIRFEPEGVWVKGTNPTEICHYKDKEEEGEKNNADTE